MGRPGLTQHRKFLRLVRLIGSAPLALGCLELMWEKCYCNGEPYLGDEVDVEAAAQWPGEPGKLCQALLTSGGTGNKGFIEEIESRPGHFQCHDLFDHAPRYVGARLKREIERQEKGMTISQLRSEAGRKGAEITNQTATEQQTSSKRAANDQQVSGKRTLICRKKSATARQIAATPAPAPAPAPAPLTDCAEVPVATSTPTLLEEPVLVFMPCVGNGSRSFGVTQGQVAQWAEAYPGLDVLQEVKKAKAWLEANPKNGKTASGMARFLVGWFSRAQNSPRPAAGGRASPQPFLRRCAAADADHQNQLSHLSFPVLAASGDP